MRGSTLRSFLSLLLVALSLLTTSAHADDGQIAILAVYVNESARGELPIVVRDQDLLLPVSALAQLGVASIAGAGDRHAIGGKQYVSLASLAPLVRYRFDHQELTLRIEVEAKRLPPSTIDLRRRAPAEIEYRKDTSLYLNYAPRLVDFRHVEAYAESGLSIRGALLWGSASLRRNGDLVRGLTNLTLDDRGAMRRWVVGDTFSSGGILGAGLHTGGVTLSRNFDLDPYYVRGPAFGLAATALTPSTLDVYVNGVLVRQQQVAPGPVRIENLPLQSGAGVATYVLRDVFGNVQSQASPFYISNGVLRKGLSEYTYSLGLAREAPGVESFSYEAPVALARHRFGLSENLTVGGRLEAGRGQVSTGATLTAVTGAGLIDLAVAGSGAHGDKAGAAFAASWAWQSRIVGVGTSLRGMSPHYATLSLAPSDNRALLEGNAYTSLSLHRRMSIGSRHALALYRDTGLVAQTSLFSTSQVAPGVSLVSTATRTVLPGVRAGNEFMLTLIVSLDRATSGQIGTRVRSDGHDELIASINRPRPRGVGAGYRASGAFANQTVDRAQVAAEAASAYGVYGALYELDPAPADPSATRRQHLTLSTQGAIVFVPGAGLFATRPVQDAIGVLQVPGVRDVRGYLNNQEVGRTDRNGNLLIPDMLPYYGNRLSIADQDLPLDYSIERTSKVVAPANKGAAIARMEVRRVLFHRGSVVVQDSARELVPADGELVVTDGEHVFESPIGKAGEVELDGVRPGSHPARILYSAGECKFMIHVPAGAGPVVEMGRQSCAIR